jgi:hypothetical protein
MAGVRILHLPPLWGSGGIGLRNSFENCQKDIQLTHSLLSQEAPETSLQARRKAFQVRILGSPPFHERDALWEGHRTENPALYVSLAVSLAPLPGRSREQPTSNVGSNPASLTLTDR